MICWLPAGSLQPLADRATTLHNVSVGAGCLENRCWSCPKMMLSDSAGNLIKSSCRHCKRKGATRQESSSHVAIRIDPWEMLVACRRAGLTRIPAHIGQDRGCSQTSILYMQPAPHKFHCSAAKSSASPRLGSACNVINGGQSN